MGNVVKDYEHPEQVWKDVYHNKLVELEEADLPQTFPIEPVLARIPKFSKWRDLWFLLVGALTCFSIAWYFSKHSLPCGFVSGVFLNLGMGIVAGIVLACFSERRTRVVNGYEVVSRTMRNRVGVLRLVLDECLVDPDFALFNLGKRDLACGWIRVHQNFVLTMKSHLEFWRTKLDGKIDLGFGAVVKTLDKKMQEIGLASGGNVLSMTQEELRVLCGNIWRVEMAVLKSYEKRIELLEARVLDVRFGTRPTTRRERLSKKSRGGSVNDQIKIDVAMENQE